MNLRKNFQLFVVSLLVVSIGIFVSCSKNPFASNNGAGGGSDTEVAKVSGVIVSADGIPVEDVDVYLFSTLDTVADNSSSKMSAKVKSVQSSYEYSVHTDSDGKFKFTDVDSGSYNLEASDEDGNKVLIPNIEVGTSDSDSVDLGEQEIKPAGFIKGKILLQGKDDHEGTTIYIGGTSYIAKSSVDGTFLLSGVAEGTYTVTFQPTQASYNEFFLKKRIKGVVVSSADTVSMGTVLMDRDESGPPARPEEVNADYDTVTQTVTISWLKNTEHDISGYIVARRHADSTKDEFVSRIVIDTFYTESKGNGLVIGESYSYHIMAEDTSELQSPYSKRVTIQTVSKSLVLAPESLTVYKPSDVGADSLSLSWNRSTEDDFKFYKVFINGESSIDTADSVIKTITSISDTSVLIKNLEQNNTYYFTVAVGDTDGYVTLGNVVSITVKNSAPEKINDLSISNIASDSVVLNWSANTEKDFKQYGLYRTVNGKDSLIAIITDSKDTVLSLSGQDETYYYSVCVEDTSGLKTFSNVVTNSSLLLTDLSLSNGILTPSFRGHGTKYSVQVSADIDSITVTPSTDDTASVITVNGKIVKSGNASQKIGLDIGANTITIKVVFGQESIDYTINITRKDVILSSLEISSGDFTPSFSPSTYTYKTNVKDSVITITPVTSDSLCVITVNGKVVKSGSLSDAINIGVGKDTVIIKVTSSSGNLSKEYSVEFTREALSSNANLSGLYLAETAISPVFGSSITEYSAGVGTIVNSVIVVPTADDSFSVIKINGNIVASGKSSEPIVLNAGQNEINIVVTAPDNKTEKTYKITVTKAIGKQIIAYWDFNSGSGNILHDKSGNGNDGIIYGATWDKDGIGGSALSFDGENDYVKVSNNSSFNGLKSMTIEAWVYLNSYGSSSNLSTIIRRDGTGSAYDDSWQLDMISTQIAPFNDPSHRGKATFNVADGTYASSGKNVITNDTISIGQWCYLVGTWDGDTSRIYLNGALSDKKYLPIEETNTNSIDVFIGRGVDGHNFYLDGKIDEIRLLNYDLKESEIMDRYEEMISNLPVKKDIIAYWKFDEGSGNILKDYSGNGNDGTIYGATWTKGLSNNALYFDGDEDYVVVPDNDLFTNMKAMTLEAWVKLDDYGSHPEWTNIINKIGTASSSDDAWHLAVLGKNGNKVQFVTCDGVTPSGETYTKEAVSLNEWVYLVGVWDGDSTWLYKNGELEDASATTVKSINNNSIPVYIGRGCPFYTHFFHGKMDEIRMLNYTLSKSEIQSRYQEFSLPDDIPATEAYWSFDSSSSGIYYDVTGNGYDAFSSDISLSTTGINGKSIECPGDSFELIVENSKDSLSCNEFTVEGWIYSTVELNKGGGGSFNDNKAIFQYTSIDTWGGFLFWIPTTGQLQLGLSADSWVWATSSQSLDKDTWYHVAASYDGSTMKVYINGELAGQNSYSGSLSTPTKDARIGCRTRPWGVESEFEGKIDEMKYYNKALADKEIEILYNISKP